MYRYTHEFWLIGDKIIAYNSSEDAAGYLDAI